MTFRYCPNCVRWLPPSRCSIDRNGTVVCINHGPVYGAIIPDDGEEPAWPLPADMKAEARNAAERQDLR